MQFAQVNEQRVRPKPSLSGLCPCCGEEVIAKCGSVKIWHWAHKSKSHCDAWYENETVWHRTWKNQFSADWSEIVHCSTSGEKHVADVKTESGLVIEFQHSHISVDERLSREKFYEQMIWVVDGTRLKRDQGSFIPYICNERRRRSPSGAIKFNLYVPQITRRWIDSSKLVYFDFGDDNLWCFSNYRGNWQGYVHKITKLEFVESCTAGYKLAGFFPRAGEE